MATSKGNSTDSQGSTGSDAGTALTFVRERETKNTVRFQEDPGTRGFALIGTLYITKAGLAAAGIATDAESVTLTLSA